jgi:uncharacterized protein involved in exopolysaccharide biosynthesis
MSNMRLAEKPEEVITPIQQDDTGSTGMLPQIDLHECLQILIRQKRVILAAIAVIMFLTYVIASSLTPRYTATVLVEINARQSQVLDFDAVLTGLPADNETIRTEIAIIQSRKIARRAIERMDLNLDPEFNSKLRAVGSIEIWRQSLAEWLDPRDRESADGSLAGEGAEAEEPLGLVGGLMRDLADFVSPRSDRSELDEGQKRKELDATIDQFLKHLTVIPQRRSRVVEISFESNSPKIAAEAANTIADFYIVAQLEAKFEATKRATTWLNERVEQLRDEVIGKERAIEQYRAQFGLLQGGQEATLATEQISELNAQHILELARLAEAQARLRQANKLLNSPEGIETSVEVLQSPLIRGLRGQESLLEREIAELSEEYGDRHPTLLNKRAELRDLRTKIQLEVKRVIQGLRNEVSIARARVASLAASLDQFKQEMAQLNQSEECVAHAPGDITGTHQTDHIARELPASRRQRRFIRGGADKSEFPPHIPDPGACVDLGGGTGGVPGLRHREAGSWLPECRADVARAGAEAAWPSAESVEAGLARQGAARLRPRKAGVRFRRVDSHPLHEPAADRRGSASEGHNDRLYFAARGQVHGHPIFGPNAGDLRSTHYCGRLRFAKAERAQETGAQGWAGPGRLPDGGRAFSGRNRSGQGIRCPRIAGRFVHAKLAGSTGFATDATAVEAA